MTRPLAQQRDRNELATISARLMTLDLDRPNVMPEVFPRMRAWLEVENLLVYSVREHGAAWRVDRWHTEGLRSEQQLRCAVDAALGNPNERILFYDHMRPAPAERNSLIEATAMIDRHGPGTWDRSSMQRNVLGPVGYGQHKQHRALLCEGAALLAWFGSIHAEALTQRQHTMLSLLLSPMRNRLMIENRLENSPRTQAALEAALERIGAPAFLVGAHGRIHECNAAGRMLLTRRRDDVTAALTDAVAGRCGAVAFELSEVRDNGTETYWLAVSRPDAETQIVAKVTECVERHALTPRQRDVLDLVVRGLTSSTIAAMLGTGERAIELHVTALFDKLGVDSRAALVARVLVGCT